MGVEGLGGGEGNTVAFGMCCYVTCSSTCAWLWDINLPQSQNVGEASGCG